MPQRQRWGSRCLVVCQKVWVRRERRWESRRLVLGAVVRVSSRAGFRRWEKPCRLRFHRLPFSVPPTSRSLSHSKVGGVVHDTAPVSSLLPSCPWTRPRLTQCEHSRWAQLRYQHRVSVSGWAGCSVESMNEETKRRRRKLTSPVDLHWAPARAGWTPQTTYTTHHGREEIDISISVLGIQHGHVSSEFQRTSNLKSLTRNPPHGKL